jgi:hypothetical protein
MQPQRQPHHRHRHPGPHQGREPPRQVRICPLPVVQPLAKGRAVAELPWLLPSVFCRQCACTRRPERLHAEAEVSCSAVNRSSLVCISAGTRRASTTASLSWTCAASTPPRPGESGYYGFTHRGQGSMQCCAPHQMPGAILFAFAFSAKIQPALDTCQRVPNRRYYAPDLSRQGQYNTMVSCILTTTDAHQLLMPMLTTIGVKLCQHCLGAPLPAALSRLSFCHLGPGRVVACERRREPPGAGHRRVKRHLSDVIKRRGPEGSTGMEDEDFDAEATEIDPAKVSRLQHDATPPQSPPARGG